MTGEPIYIPMNFGEAVKVLDSTQARLERALLLLGRFVQGHHDECQLCQDAADVMGSWPVPTKDEVKP